MRRSFGNHDFQRWPNLSLQEMAAPRRSVRQSKHRVKMKADLAIFVAPNISEYAQHLALFVDQDATVIFRVEIEPTDRGTLECTDRGDRCSTDIFACGKGLDGAECFFTRFKNDSEKPVALAVA